MQRLAREQESAEGSILRVLRRCTPRADLEHLQPKVPIVSVCGGVAVGAFHSASLQDRVSRHNAWVILQVAMRARQCPRVDVGSAFVALAQVHLLLHTLIHGPSENPVADFFDLLACDVRALRQVQVVGRGDVGLHEVGVVDSRVLGVVDGVGDVEEAVQEEERHVDHARRLAVDPGLVERAVHGKLRAVPAQCDAGFRDELDALLLLLEAAADGEEVRREEGLVELHGLGAPVLGEGVGRRRQRHDAAARHEAQEHLPEHAGPRGVVDGEELGGDDLVELEVRLLGRRAVPDERLAGLEDLALVRLDLAVLHEVVRQHLGAVLLREHQALLPVAVAGVHVQRAVHVPGLADQLVAVAERHQVVLVPLLDDADHLRALLLRQHPRLLPDLAGDVAVDRVAERLDALVQLGRGVVALDHLQPLRDHRDDVVVALLGVLHGEPHGVLPDLLEAVGVGGAGLVDGQVGVDGPRVVPRLLVDLRRVEDLLQALRRGAGAPRPAFAVGVDDVPEHLRAVLLAHAHGLVHHALRGVRLHRQLRLPRLDEEVLGRLQVVLVDHVLCMVHHHFLHALTVKCFRDAHRRDPVALVDVHVDGLLGLVRLDELLLCELELLIVLQGKCLFQVDVRELVLRRMGGELEGVLEVAVLHGVVDRDLDEPVLGQQLRAGLGAVLLEGGVRLREHDLLEGGLAAVVLRDALGVLPLLQLAVHGHGARPHLRLHVVVLGLLQVPLHLELLGDVLVGVVQELLPVLRHEPQHLLVLLALLVHVDGEVELVHHDVQLLGLVQLPLLLEAVRQAGVELRPLVVRHVRLGHLVGLLVLPGVDVHLDGLLRPVGLDERALGLLELPREGVVLRELLVEGQHELGVRAHGRLVEELLRLVPLPRRHGRVDRLRPVAGLDVVVDRGVDLPLRDQPVAPALLELHDQRRLRVLRQLDGLPVRVSSAVRIHRRAHQPHALVEFPGPVVHAAVLQAADDLLQELLRVVGVVPLHHGRGLRRHPAAQVQLDGPDVVALLFLQLARLLLLLR
mmetsp:Transcript_4359/g.12271  ORF Transcript_4359/g.12271 Transcript_4359/m.12271 type:complete len:1023 (-) Transcript_4359:1504-4572(-)